MAHEVFISHSSKDRAWAEAICQTLEANGVSCWVAPRDIPAGVEYPKALSSALKQCKVFILIFSADSNESVPVMKEVEGVYAWKVPIIPFRIEDVPLAEGMDYLLSTPQWINAFTPPPEKHLAALVPAVQKLLETAQTPAARVIVPRVPKALLAQRRLRRLQISVAAAVLLLLACGLSYYLYNRKDSLAILPITNESGDPHQDAYCEGVAEDIIDNLSQIGNLTVMSLAATKGLPPAKANPKDASQELGVHTVMTGKLRKTGSKDFEVHADLDDSKNVHIWGATIPVASSDFDVLKLRNTIATNISENLQVHMSDKQKARIAKRPTESNPAYKHYLDARFNWNKRDENGFRDALTYFEQAIASDPKFALAYSGLADTYSLQADYSIVPPKQGFPKAGEAARKAIALDSELAEAHTSLAFVLYQYEWRWDAAEAEFRRALKLSPSYATTHQWYAIYLAAMGRHEDALAEIRFSQKLDPKSPILATNIGWLLYLAGQDDEAMQRLQKVAAAYPKFAEAHRQLGVVYEHKKMYAEAIAELEAALDLEKDSVEYQALLARAMAFAGRREEAQKQLEKLKTHSRYMPASYLATIYVGLGDKDQALKYLTQSVDDKSDEMTLLKVEPEWESLRGDPRFEVLVKKVGLP